MSSNKSPKKNFDKNIRKRKITTINLDITSSSSNSSEKSSPKKIKQLFSDSDNENNNQEDDLTFGFERALNKKQFQGEKGNILLKLQNTYLNDSRFKLDSKFKEEWFNTMSDFISQYVYMIPVPYKTEVDYYEIISQIPCLMRGAFLNEDANSEHDVIDFKIIAPNNKVIFEASSIGKIFSLKMLAA